MNTFRITVYDEGRGGLGEHLRDVEAENADVALACVGYEEILAGVHRDTRDWPVVGGVKSDDRYSIVADLVEVEA